MGGLGHGQATHSSAGWESEDKHRCEMLLVHTNYPVLCNAFKRTHINTFECMYMYTTRE